MKWYQVSTQNGVSTYVMNTPTGCIVRIENQVPDVDDYRPTATFVPATWWNVAKGAWVTCSIDGHKLWLDEDWDTLGSTDDADGDSNE